MKIIIAFIVIIICCTTPIKEKKLVFPSGWNTGCSSDTFVLVPIDRFRLLLDSASAVKFNYDNCVQSKKLK